MYLNIIHTQKNGICVYIIISLSVTTAEEAKYYWEQLQENEKERQMRVLEYLVDETEFNAEC